MKTGLGHKVNLILFFFFFKNTQVSLCNTKVLLLKMKKAGLLMAVARQKKVKMIILNEEAQLVV